MRGMVWPGRLFARGFWDGGGGQPMEVEILNAQIAQTDVLALCALRPPGVRLLLASSPALASTVGCLYVY